MEQAAVLLITSQTFLRDEYVLAVSVYGTIIHDKKQTRHLPNVNGGLVLSCFFALVMVFKRYNLLLWNNDSLRCSFQQFGHFILILRDLYRIAQ